MTVCIEKKAYELWEQDGRRHGRDLDYWLIAEKTVTSGIKNNIPKNRVCIKGRKIK